MLHLILSLTVQILKKKTFKKTKNKTMLSFSIAKHFMTLYCKLWPRKIWTLQSFPEVDWLLWQIQSKDNLSSDFCPFRDGTAAGMRCGQTGDIKLHIGCVLKVTTPVGRWWTLNGQPTVWREVGQDFGAKSSFLWGYLCQGKKKEKNLLDTVSEIIWHFSLFFSSSFFDIFMSSPKMLRSVS